MGPQNKNTQEADKASAEKAEKEKAQAQIDAKTKADAETAKAQSGPKGRSAMVQVFSREERIITIPPGLGHNGTTLRHGMNQVDAKAWDDANKKLNAALAAA